MSNKIIIKVDGIEIGQIKTLDYHAETISEKNITNINGYAHSIKFYRLKISEAFDYNLFKQHKPLQIEYKTNKGYVKFNNTYISDFKTVYEFDDRIIFSGFSFNSESIIQSIEPNNIKFNCPAYKRKNKIIRCK